MKKTKLETEANIEGPEKINLRIQKLTAACN